MSATVTVDRPTTILDLDRNTQEKISDLLSKADQASFSKGTYTKQRHIEEHQKSNAIETIVITEMLRWALHIFLKDKTVQKGVFDIDFGWSSGNSISDDPEEDDTWRESLHFTFTYQKKQPAVTWDIIRPSGTIDISFWAFIPDYPTKQEIDGKKIGPPHKWFPTYEMIANLTAERKGINSTITATYEGDKVTGITGLNQINLLNFNPVHYQEWTAQYRNVINGKQIKNDETRLGFPRLQRKNMNIPLLHDLARALDIKHDMYTKGLADMPLLVYGLPAPTAPTDLIIPTAPTDLIIPIPIGIFQSTIFKKNVLNYTASINLLRKREFVPPNVLNACVIFLLHIYNQVGSFASDNEYRPKYKDLTKLTVTPLPKDKYDDLKDLQDFIANNDVGLLLSGCTFLYNFSNQSRVLVIDNDDETLFWLEGEVVGGGKLKKPTNGKIHVRKEPIQGYNRAIYKLVGKGNTLFVDIKGICKRYTDVK